jgi:hypothetical protein
MSGIIRTGKYGRHNLAEITGSRACAEKQDEFKRQVHTNMGFESERFAERWTALK